MIYPKGGLVNHLNTPLEHTTMRYRFCAGMHSNGFSGVGPMPRRETRMSEDEVLAHVALFDVGFGIKDRGK